MANLFDSVPVPDYQESQFNGNHTIKATAKVGAITPTKCIKYHPGDKFRMRSITNVNFPPLLSPAYQSFKLKEYLFKVRKGLTFGQEDFGKFLLSARDGSTPPVMPKMTLSNHYYFGQSVVVVKFNPKLPVYGLFSLGDVYFQTSDIPTNSLNWWLMNFGSLTDDQRKELMDIFVDGFSFEVIDKNRFIPTLQNKYRIRAEHMYDYESEASGDVTIMPSYVYTTYKRTVQADGHHSLAPSVSIATAPVSTINNVTFAKLAPDTRDNYVYEEPFYRNGELAESLGYPTFNLDFQESDFVLSMKKRIKEWADALTKQPSLIFTEELRLNDRTPVLFTDGVTELPFLETDHSAWHYNSGITAVDLLQCFAQYAISHGYGDGKLIQDAHGYIGFCAATTALRDYYCYPVDKSGSPYEVDLGPLTAYWKVYNEYFRDPNVSVEVPLFTLAGDELLTNNNAYRFPNNNLDLFGNTVSIPYVHATLTPTQISAFIQTPLLYSYRMRQYGSIPQKCIDRNYFTSALPDVSKVQVFAPVIPSLPSNGVTVDKSQTVDYAPTTSVSPSTTFMSIDAFRTANVMQSFYINATLAGPRPVSFILMMFGEHSKDFRMEVPELISANERPISIHEITQSSETDQLPLGHEAAKMTITKGLDEGFDFVDSDGDHGYIIRMVCIYPEILEVGGMNKDLMCVTPFDFTFFPQFAILGEESIKQFEIDAQPMDIAFQQMVSATNEQNTCKNSLVYHGTTGDKDYGYTDRYGHLKFIPSETHGRFLTDMKYWTLDRIKYPRTYDVGDDSELINLTPHFLAVPKDNRMFVDDEAQNCFIDQFVQCEFTRKLPIINLTKLL